MPLKCVVFHSKDLVWVGTSIILRRSVTVESVGNIFIRMDTGIEERDGALTDQRGVAHVGRARPESAFVQFRCSILEMEKGYPQVMLQ